MRRPVRWRTSRGFRRLATVALLALAAALVSGHAALMLLAAPLLATAAAAPRGRRPKAVDVTIVASPERCFEGEEVELILTTAPGDVMDEISSRLELPDGLSLVSGAVVQSEIRAGRAEARWTISPAIWGRHQLGTVHVTCRSRGGVWTATLALPAGTIDVYPRPPVTRARLVPPDLLRRIGEHTGRAAGEGIELTAVRPYLPGDRLRDVNWAATSRRRQLHVNQRAAQRAADLVVMIDAFSEVGPPGDSTIDTSVHGAAALVSAYLRIGDRAGVVTLGGMLRWLGPAPGERQFYRIAETVLDLRYDSEVMPDLGRIPRTALPPGALVVLFSPLLDPRTLTAISDLQARGFSLVVVDVLRQDPPETQPPKLASLALRLWRLDREVLRSGLANAGVPVISWGAGEELDAVLAPVRRVPVAAGRRR
ncbi:MAG TPA: DUF58 domain-containing protein [Streptosporangiaceae bacterium]|nr:DUF58 domain-containing protein [Streptosporangiaceae bacterium]